MKKSSFVWGATILALSGVLCKILGALYKVPLANMLKTEGMGIYYLVFPIYSLFLTLSSSCFPSVVSRMVSSAVAENKNKLAYKTFIASLIVLLILGLFFSLILTLFANKIASFQGVKNGAICYVVLSPAILFVAIISAFRGYFQGLQDMTPTAISQIVEQIVKFVVGFFLANLLLKYGVIYGVLGALVGVVFSELLSLCYLAICFFKFRKKTKTGSKYEENVGSVFCIMKHIIKASIPFFLNGVLFPLFSVVDGVLIVALLQRSGYEFSLASSILGINTGVVNTIINLPVVVSVSIAMAIVPSISFSFNKGDIASIENKVSFSIKIVFLIAIPCIFMFVFYAKEIISLLFGGSMNSVAEFNVAINLLIVLSITVLYQSLLQIFVAVLQAIKKAYTPVVVVFLSLVFRVVVQVLLFRIESINIMSIGISSFVGFFFACLFCFLVLKKSIKISLDFKSCLILPVLFSVLIVFLVKAGLIFFYMFLPAKVSILASFLMGGFVYLIMLYCFKVVSKKELIFIKNTE